MRETIFNQPALKAKFLIRERMKQDNLKLGLINQATTFYNTSRSPFAKGSILSPLS